MGLGWGRGSATGRHCATGLDHGERGWATGLGWAGLGDGQRREPPGGGVAGRRGAAREEEERAAMGGDGRLGRARAAGGGPSGVTGRQEEEMTRAGANPSCADGKAVGTV